MHSAKEDATGEDENLHAETVEAEEVGMRGGGNRDGGSVGHSAAAPILAQLPPEHFEGGEEEVEGSLVRCANEAKEFMLYKIPTLYCAMGHSGGCREGCRACEFRRFD